MDKFSGLELDVETPYRLPLLNPVTRQPIRDNEGKEAYIEHYSNDSEIARKQNRDIQRRRLAMRGRMKITPEELEAEAVDLLVALTVGWYLVDYKNGEVIDTKYNPEDGRKLYSRVAWIREQLEESTTERANFSQGSSSS